MHILAGVLRQVSQRLRIRNVLAPAVKILIHRLGVMEIGLRHWHLIKPNTVHLIRHTHRNLLKPSEHIQLSNEQISKPINAHRLTRKHRIVPAAAARTARVHAKLAAGRAQKLAHLIEQLSGERASTHTGGVRLLNTDHTGNAGGANTRTHTGAPSSRVRRGNKRVGAVIDVKEGRLAALHKQGFTLIKRLIEQLSSINNHGLKPLSEREEIIHNLVHLNMAAVIHLHQQLILLPQRALNLLPQNRLIQNILHTNTQAAHLIHIGGPNTAPGRTNRALTQETLRDLIHRLMVRGHQVGVRRDFKLRSIGTARLQPLNLGEKRLRVHHHAVTNHGGRVLTQNTSGQQLQLKLLPIHHHRVASIIAAIRLDHVIHAGAEQIGCLALPLIAPLGTHDDDS